MILNREETKQKCIEELEKLIQNIKEDETSENYSFNWELLAMESGFGCTVRDVRYSIERREIFKGDTDVSITFNHSS